MGWRSQGGGQTSRSGHGGGGPLGSGEGNTFQDCGKPSINWYNGKIIDTGNPDANYFPTAPGQFNHMGQVYANNNVTIVNGVTSVVPAQNGIATGQPQSATQCNSQWMGFDHAGFYGSRSGYYWWNWYLLHPFIPAINFATDYALSGGFARGGGGGNSGVCPQNLRLIRAQIQQGSGWKNFMACVDTGTPQSMIGSLVGGRGGGGRGSSIQMKFDPNPNPISVPYDNENRGGVNYVPAYYISKRVDVCLTNQYTIVRSRSDNKTVSYSCSSGQITNTDALNGKEWSMHPLQSEVPSLSPQFNPKTSNTRAAAGWRR